MPIVIYWVLCYVLLLFGVCGGGGPTQLPAFKKQNKTLLQYVATGCLGVWLLFYHYITVYRQQFPLVLEQKLFFLKSIGAML